MNLSNIIMVNIHTHACIIIPHACARGKVIGRVIVIVVVVVVVHKKLPDLEIYAPERFVSTTNLLNLVINWLQYAQN